MKRLTDIIISLTLLGALFPLIVLISIFAWLKIGRPIFFTQIRPGKGGQPFAMTKFRSMKNLVDSQGNPLSDSERLTKFGRLLRATSLDELPELWNVLKGEMSLVGPRPLLMEYLPLYNERQMRRHEVRPGITGWAQVNGRNAISWEQKFELDLYYVENQSLWLDAKILLMTVMKVFAKEGISSETSATMEKFTGNERN
ncbi:sugar transferase [Pelagicoccus sp. SDUM812005]|uniref:sugar transferase n=1 Tax=Pelagicoccus sp. SDUM812005 TaxID=3041257 RepID=UPI00280FD5CD|nr:sugar transferase [Pelagicoccus sp. SDUM812005]MDQ8180803.1 sugar transferase [Pelagicoccus sp. SDUM812005]